MKKLNRKGFTLIELLAVIVILAIIMVVTIPEILNTMDSSRISSLSSSAKGVASWWEEAAVSDTLVSTDKQLVTGATLSSTAWTCLGTLKNVNDKDMFTVSGLKDTDIKKDGSVPTGTPTAPVVAKETCSAVAKDANGKVVVLLIAKAGGKFNVNTLDVTYALSSQSEGLAGATCGTLKCSL